MKSLPDERNMRMVNSLRERADHEAKTGEPPIMKTLNRKQRRARAAHARKSKSKAS